ncbi:MAG: phosphoribosylglycinamide formyltransferase, partial [Deltaproteobacteria bacterium]|nr:phosphoribosylglycinamide formyltransferase [Deltaproteobacteria bacterium]
DTGPIIEQTRVSVDPTDTAETLAARILQREQTFYPETLQKIVTGTITLPTKDK